MNKVEQIKNSVDIVDIIQNYIQLTKKGKNYWGICPFHDDSNPSMSVSQEKQLYNCFSCNNSGDVFKFVSQIEKISFKDAVNLAGKDTGIQINIKTESTNYNENQKKVIEALSDANDFFVLSINTKEAQEALNYADSRGLNPKIREYFDIGFSPENKLSNYLQKIKLYDKSVLINASLTNGFGKDFFKNRLMFGIRNEFNDIVGFSGRTIKNEDSKYINSSESLVFKKNNILYNWNRAKESSIIKKEVIIVEGFMDVIALYKSGIENVVAIMGTAFTKENIYKIRNIVVNLMLDNDKAGLNATIKSIRMLISNNIKVYVIQNPKKDIDDLYQNGGKESVIDSMKKKETALEFIYNLHIKEFNPTSINESEKMMMSFRKYLQYGSDSEKDIFSMRIEKDYKISKKTSLKGIGTTENIQYQKNIEPKNLQQINSININFNKPSFRFISSMIKSKQLCVFYNENYNRIHFIDKNQKHAADTIKEYHLSGMPIPNKVKKYIKPIYETYQDRVGIEHIEELIIKMNNSQKSFIRQKYKKNNH